MATCGRIPGQHKEQRPACQQYSSASATQVPLSRCRLMWVSSIFSPKLPHALRRTPCEHTNMNLSHAKQWITARRSRPSPGVVRNAWSATDRAPSVRMPALAQTCINTGALDEKLNDFPSPAFRSGENPVICRLWRNPEARLTVKFRRRIRREILPSDLPSKPSAWGR
jgi:hypothetical protein